MGIIKKLSIQKLSLELQNAALNNLFHNAVSEDKSICTFCHKIIYKDQPIQNGVRQKLILNV